MLTLEKPELPKDTASKDQGKSMVEVMREKAQIEERNRREDQENREKALRYAAENGLEAKFNAQKEAVAHCDTDVLKSQKLSRYTAEWKKEIDRIQKETDQVQESIQSLGRNFRDTKIISEQLRVEYERRKTECELLKKSKKLGERHALVLELFNRFLCSTQQKFEKEQEKIIFLENSIRGQQELLQEKAVQRRAYGISYAKIMGERDRIARILKKGLPSGATLPQIAKAIVTDPYEDELTEFCKNNSDYLRPENYPIEERVLLMLHLLTEAEWQTDPEIRLGDILVQGLRTRDPRLLTDKPRAKLRGILNEDVMDLFSRTKKEAAKALEEKEEQEAAERSQKLEASASGEREGDVGTTAKMVSVPAEGQMSERTATPQTVGVQEVARPASLHSDRNQGQTISSGHSTAVPSKRRVPSFVVLAQLAIEHAKKGRKKLSNGPFISVQRWLLNYLKSSDTVLPRETAEVLVGCEPGHPSQNSPLLARLKAVQASFDQLVAEHNRLQQTFIEVQQERDGWQDQYLLQDRQYDQQEQLLDAATQELQRMRAETRVTLH